MKTFMQYIRMYIFRGLMAIIPISLSALAIQLLYVLIDKRAVSFLEQSAISPAWASFWC